MDNNHIEKKPALIFVIDRNFKCSDNEMIIQCQMLIVEFLALDVFLVLIIK